MGFYSIVMDLESWDGFGIELIFRVTTGTQHISTALQDIVEFSTPDARQPKGFSESSWFVNILVSHWATKTVDDHFVALTKRRHESFNRHDP